MQHLFYCTSNLTLNKLTPTLVLPAMGNEAQANSTSSNLTYLNYKVWLLSFYVVCISSVTKAYCEKMTEARMHWKRISSSTFYMVKTRTGWLSLCYAEWFEWELRWQLVSDGQIQIMIWFNTWLNHWWWFDLSTKDLI